MIFIGSEYLRSCKSSVVNSVAEGKITDMAGRARSNVDIGQIFTDDGQILGDIGSKCILSCPAGPQIPGGKPRSGGLKVAVADVFMMARAGAQ